MYAVDGDKSAGSGVKAIKYPQERALARATWSEDAQHLTSSDSQVQLVQNLRVSVVLIQAARLDDEVLVTRRLLTTCRLAYLLSIVREEPRPAGMGQPAEVGVRQSCAGVRLRPLV